MSNVFLIVFLLLIFKILGCVWDFRIIDCAVAMLLVLFPGLPSISSGEPEVFSTMLADSELNKLESLDLSVTIFPFFSIAMVSFVRKPFLVRKGLTVFQNVLLLRKPFSVTLRKYAFSTDLVNLLQNFLAFFKAAKSFP